jgi:hypothetical protein
VVKKNWNVSLLFEMNVWVEHGHMKMSQQKHRNIKLDRRIIIQHHCNLKVIVHLILHFDHIVVSNFFDGMMSIVCIRSWKLFRSEEEIKLMPFICILFLFYNNEREIKFFFCSVCKNLFFSLSFELL